VTRRKMLWQMVTAMTVTALNPRCLPDGTFSFVAPAHAWILAALSIAASAASLFVKSDGGLKAYFGALKGLAEENIRLSQEIIKGVASIQANLEQLPERMREILIEHSQYQVRHVTGSIQSNLEFVRFRIDEDPRALDSREVRAKLRQCIEWGGALAGAKDVPYGVGPVGAMCAPIVAGSVAKAHTLLGQGRDIRAEMAAKYLPWIQRIQDPSVPSSMADLLIREGKNLGVLEDSLGSRLPPRLRDRLGERASAIGRLTAGSSIENVPIACVSYQQQVANKVGKCVSRVCDGTIGPHSVPPSDGFELLSASPAVLSDLLGRGCYCDRWEVIPIYGDATQRGLFVSVTNTTEAETGPGLNVRGMWGAVVANQAKPGGQCDVGARGVDVGEQKEVEIILASSPAKEWMAELRALDEKGVQPIIQQREIIWAYYHLLLSMREAEQRMRGIFKL